MTGKEPTFIAALPFWVDALCALGITALALLPLWLIHREVK